MDPRPSMGRGRCCIGFTRVLTSASAHATRSLAVGAAVAGQWTRLLAGHGQNDWYGEGC
jgi:hypothetical protein